MITFREYEIEDWAKIDDAIEPFVPLMAIKDFLEMTKRGVAITGVENGLIMACGGVSYANDKEGIVWLKVSRKCLTRPVRWARTIHKTFDLMAKSVGNLSISTYILDNFCKGEKLAGLIGLRKTDEMEEYNGNTYHKYTVVI